MAKKKISQLPATTGLLNTHLIEVSKAPHGAGTSESATLLDVKNYVLNGFPTIKQITKVITAGEVAAFFTTPIVLIPAVVGKRIIPMNIISDVPAGTAYSDPDFTIYHDTAAQPILFDSNLLAGNTLRSWNHLINWVAAGNGTQLLVNKALMIGSPSVNPSGGTYGITWIITYMEI